MGSQPISAARSTYLQSQQQHPHLLTCVRMLSQQTFSHSALRTCHTWAARVPVATPLEESTSTQVYLHIYYVRCMLSSPTDIYLQLTTFFFYFLLAAHAMRCLFVFFFSQNFWFISADSLHTCYSSSTFRLHLPTSPFVFCVNFLLRHSIKLLTCWVPLLWVILLFQFLYYFRHPLTRLAVQHWNCNFSAALFIRTFWNCILCTIQLNLTQGVIFFWYEV